jgi:hypothetical protein
MPRKIRILVFIVDGLMDKQFPYDTHRVQLKGDEIQARCQLSDVQDHGIAGSSSMKILKQDALVDIVKDNSGVVVKTVDGYACIRRLGVEANGACFKWLIDAGARAAYLIFHPSYSEDSSVMN